MKQRKPGAFREGFPGWKALATQRKIRDVWVSSCQGHRTLSPIVEQPHILGRGVFANDHFLCGVPRFE